MAQPTIASEARDVHIAHQARLVGFLAGGGEMGRRMRAHDWSRTPLGPADRWPATLKTATRIILTTRQPMLIVWGAERVVLYNDACRGVVAQKHPQLLGQPAPAVWGDMWERIGERVAC